MRPRSFADFMRRPESEINVAEAALLFAREMQPSLDVGLYLAKIDAYTRKARVRGVRPDHPTTSVTTLCRLLFDELGFQGNNAHYQDPLNSYLNQVIDRRLGIPITLCALFVEVGHRAGLDLAGVGFPGHFLALERQTGLLIDCFAGGKIISPDDCETLLRSLYGPKANLSERFLRPAKPKETLVRMLNNLKLSYASRQEYRQALKIVELVEGAWPDLPENVRDRGLLNMALQQFPQALRDLERYARLAPKASDAREVIERITQLKKTLATLN